MLRLLPAPAAVYAPPAPAPVANNVPPAPAPDASRERISGLPSNTTTRTAPTAPAAPPAPAANTAPAAPAPVANNPPPAQQPVAESAPPAAASTTPLGLWQTADNKGNVRIEECGTNLCGFAEHTNERILINMKPSSDNNKWTGRIHDPDSGSNYNSIIAMKGPNLLKVQGCAFGGLFCGGQTWKRVANRVLPDWGAMMSSSHPFLLAHDRSRTSDVLAANCRHFAIHYRSPD